MRFCHAVVLALMGWYLMVPPAVAVCVTDSYGRRRVRTEIPDDTRGGEIDENHYAFCS